MSKSIRNLPRICSQQITQIVSHRFIVRMTSVLRQFSEFSIARALASADLMCLTIMRLWFLFSGSLTALAGLCSLLWIMAHEAVSSSYCTVLLRFTSSISFDMLFRSHTLRYLFIHLVHVVWRRLVSDAMQKCTRSVVSSSKPQRSILRVWCNTHLCCDCDAEDLDSRSQDDIASE